MKKIILGFVVLLVGVGAGWYVFGSNRTGSEKSLENTMPVPGVTGVEEMVVSEEETRVTYTDSGYIPKEVTVKKGTVVTFMNDASGSMWVASAPHPTHTNYPEFDQLKSVGKGESYKFTFTKVGTWKYHNHMKPTDFGSVTVTE